MAHADYDCCAICDCKLSYNGFDANTKEEICSGCLHSLRDAGINALDVEELKQWIRTEDTTALSEKLAKIGFTFCYYSNEVDELVKQRLPDFKGKEK